MRLGEVIDAVAEFLRLVAVKDYASAAALGQRIDGSTAQEILGPFADMQDDIGKMPPDGWRSVHVQGPIETTEGLVVLADVPVWDREGNDMDWFFKFALGEGHGEEWCIDYVNPSN